MNSLYKFVNDKQIQPYEGEILTEYDSDKVVKVISNPTNTDLREFGYMQLVTDANIPDYDPSTQSVEITYAVKDDMICQIYRVVDNEIGDITII